MTDNQIDVKIGATTGELKTGMAQAESTVKQGVQGMQTPFDRIRDSVTGGMKQMQGSVTNSVSAISSSLGSLGKIAGTAMAVLAGGYFFKSAIDSMSDFVSEAKRVKEAMGGTIDDAAALAYAYKRVGVSGSDVEGLMRSIVRTINATEGDYNKLGVRIKDVNGNLVSAKAYLFENLEKLKNYEEGLKRTTAAAEAFGMRGVTNISKFLKVTIVDVENAKRLLESLGMTIGPEMEASLRAFKIGMADAQLVVTALQFQIASRLLPALTELAKFFSDQGPAAIRITIDFFRDMSAAGVTLQADWKIMQISCKAAWDYIVEVVRGGTGAVVSLMRGNGDAAAAAWEAGLNRAKLSTQKAMNEVREIVNNANAEIDKIKNPPKTEPKPFDPIADPKNPPKTGGGGKGGGASLVQQWVQELEQMKAAEEKYQSQSLQMEKAFWAKKLATGKAASGEETDALKAQELASEAIRLKTEADYWKGKLLLAAAGTKDYQEVQHKIVTLEQQQNKLRLQSEIGIIKSKIKAGEDTIKDKMALIEHENQLDKLNLKMKENNIAHLAKMGAMNRVQELREYKNLKKEEHLTDLKAAQDQAIAKKNDLKAYQEHLKKIELLKKKQALELQQIDFEITEAMKAQWGQVWNAVSQAFSMSVQGIITGTTTLADAIKNIWQSILTSLVGMFLQMALEYVAAKVMMLIFGEASDKIMAASAVGAEAAIAGAAGVASVMVALPFPANIAVAPIVGAGAAALAASFGVLASAAGGWDVPADTLAMVHKDEKILPADWPEKLRAVAAPGGGAAGIQIEKLTFAPTLVMKQSMTHAYAEEITRKYLFPAFKNELDRFGLSLGRG